MISHSNCRSALGLTGLLYLQEGPHVCVYTGSNGACNVRYHHVVVVMKKKTQISINVLFMADLIFNAPTKVYSLISFIKKGEELCFFHTVFFYSLLQGDSGGPLVCDVNGVWELVGATSWGLQNCPTSSPTVYTRVSNYLSWISANTDAL